MENESGFYPISVNLLNIMLLSLLQAVLLIFFFCFKEGV